MRIQSIEVKNYKAFLGTHKINVKGKNLFIYGENGSGKSSLYYALKDFFQSSFETIDLQELRNLFSSSSNVPHVEVKFRIGNDKMDTSFPFGTNDIRIRDANKLKSFLTYKHLLNIHYLKNDEEINLFDLLVKGVLKHFKSTLAQGKELGELWLHVEKLIAKPTGASYHLRQKKIDINAAIEIFNNAFSELFSASSPDYILTHARPILNLFGHNIGLDLRYAQATPNADYSALERQHVYIDLTYAGERIAKPHLFLNEARLSAIAISIYLGMIKRHPQLIECKILFLDDIFIGLDISNRLPLLEILDSQFSDYQIFVTTYDKPWFEFVKGLLDSRPSWKMLEFYAKKTNRGYEIPHIVDDQTLLKKAKKHLQQSDYKAAAVYTRSHFEKIIRSHCEKARKSLVFKSKIKDYSSQDFWSVIKGDLLPSTKNAVEQYRELVLNAFSHYNTEKHEIRRELDEAIRAIEGLEAELIRLRPNQTASSS